MSVFPIFPYGTRGPVCCYYNNKEQTLPITPSELDINDYSTITTPWITTDLLTSLLCYKIFCGKGAF